MFEKLNLEELSSEKQRVTSNNEFLEQFVMMPKGPGSTVIRILPPLQGKRLFQYNRVHDINGRRVHCRRPLVNGRWDRSVRCPICDMYQSLWKQADRCTEKGQKVEAEEFKDKARQIKPVERYYYNAIVRQVTSESGAEKSNVGPKILSVGKILHGMIVTTIIGDDRGPGKGNIADPKNGYDFVIKKELKGEFANYDKSYFAQSPSPAGTKEEIERWAKQMHDLTKLRNPKSIDDLEREIAIHHGIIPDVNEFDLEAIREKFRPQEPVESSPTQVAVKIDLTAAQNQCEEGAASSEGCDSLSAPEPEDAEGLEVEDLMAEFTNG